ncbi:MAG: NAD(P)-dependent oxidoreductase [Calditrichia bacterium]
MKENVAFIGLGAMGKGMALRLLEAGFPVKVYNRTREKMKPLTDKGAESAESPADAVTPGSVLVTMLSDDNAVEAVADSKLLKKLGKGSIHLSMSTLSPEGAGRLARRHAEFGVDYLGCPVFGRPDVASAGKLWLCLAGNSVAKNRVRPLLDAVGQGVYDFGDKPELANVVKIAGNFLIASAIEAMAEAFAFMEKNGADAGKAHGLFSESLFNCLIHKNYGKAILERSFSPAGFRLSLGAKDVRLIRDTARNSHIPMPLAALLEDRFLRSLAHNREELDWSAISLNQREDAGLSS